MKIKLSKEETDKIFSDLGLDETKYDKQQFYLGVNVELEHGTVNPQTNVTNDDPIVTGKIAAAHLNEDPKYYDHLLKMEAENES